MVDWLVCGFLFGVAVLLFLLLLGDHEPLEVPRVDLAAVDLELGEGVVHLLLAELVSPRHQRVSEPEAEGQVNGVHSCEVLRAFLHCGRPGG